MKQLPAIVNRKAKRVGRGYGSGKGGHTSGRGSKGQKARGDVPIIFEGTKIKKSLIKRLPFVRGRGKFKPTSQRAEIINLKDLINFPKGSVINKEFLIKEGFPIKGDIIKILGLGEIKNALKFEKVKLSKSAREKIIAAGGEIIE
jgi:large subunit ribosomal protein L15